MATSVRAVATSWRPLRPSRPIVRAPPSEKTPRPRSVLTPIRMAPAAPAKDPLGSACAANADPRRTVKNPTTPPTTATMLATSHALTMKPENMVVCR